MIEILRIVAIPCLFVAPFAGWLTFSFFRDGEVRAGWKAAGVFAITASVLAVAYSEVPAPKYAGGDCRKDWDGFSNPDGC